ncbi:L-threonine ammonia-lyase-like [Ptychodera flava]|uniref:L-threonine ammonia-lyase-like n=1 Tax=Ptychodera flava TaxID=63121 RepID=UPI00396AA67B
MKTEANKMPTAEDSLEKPVNGVVNSKNHDDNEEELKDEFCDPENPIVVRFQDVSAAAYKIKNGIQRTPCQRSHMSAMTGVEIFFKKEFLQYTGSFKERGARYTLLMLPQEQKQRGVIAASAGNHALALSYHGKDLGIPVFVVMPIIAPIMKISLCKQHGANVIVTGADLGESKKYAMKLAQEKGLQYINGYDHPHILAGQGTMGLEIVEQVPDIDAVVVPVGGAGLIAGTALAVKSLYPHIQVIGAEAERCASFKAAIDAGHPVYTKVSSTLADGLAVPTVGVNAFATARPLVDKVVTVSEDYIALAILRLIELEKAVVEGAGATGLAAILAGKLPELEGKKVVIPLCGGNIDTAVLGRCIERGLAADGRLCRFIVQVSDRPGGIAELTKLIADAGVSLKDIFHERAWLRTDIFSVQVKCVVETRDEEHGKELEKILRERYDHVAWGPHNA